MFIYTSKFIDIPQPYKTRVFCYIVSRPSYLPHCKDIVQKETVTYFDIAMIFISIIFYFPILIEVKASVSTEPGKICNYTGVCTVGNDGSPSAVRHAGVRCCQPCICSDRCVLRNCCPGSRPHPTMRASCRSQEEMYNAIRGQPAVNDLVGVYKDYQVVDSCPLNSSEILQQPCSTPETLEDHVMVSSLDNSIVFKNSKCAQCNGVSDYIEWAMIMYNVTSTPDTISNDIVRVKWRTHFNIYSVPPRTYTDELAAHECIYRIHPSLLCPIDFPEANIREQCVSDTFLLYNYKGIAYPNEYCFACDAMDLQVVCDTADRLRTFSIVPFVVVIDYKSFNEKEDFNGGSKGNGECGTGSIMNPITVSS